MTSAAAPLVNRSRPGAPEAHAAPVPSGRARGAPILFVAMLAFALHGCAAPGGIDLDAPDDHRPRGSAAHHPASYDAALAAWRTPEQLNRWIGDTFEYDRARALRLSESQREARGTLPIHAPAAFYARPSGVCVDLARFAVETLQAVAPELGARYLMIEFAPATVQGNVLRRHWVAAFERDGQLWVFADSKRPGHIAGPYPSAQAYVEAYADFRGREVVAFRESTSYQRRARAAASAPRRTGT